MNEKLESFFDLPIGHKLLTLAITLLLLGGGYWFLYFTPVQEEIASSEERVERLTLDINKKKGIVRNLPEYRARVQVLDEELEKALRELPDKEEIDLLLSSVSDKAKDAGLDISLFKPANEEKRDFYAAVPVSIEASGSYHEVATFFDEVGHLERIVNLDRFSMEEPVRNKDSIELKTKVTATAFRFLDESERPSKEEETKGRRRRR